MNKTTQKDVPHYIGHRKRLKKKFLDLGPGSLSDHELLEMILFQSIPRRDVKCLAKTLLKKFDNFNGILNASKKQLLEIDGINETVFLNFQAAKEWINRLLKEHFVDKNIISSWAQLLDYLKFNMRNMKIEQFRVLFLNKKNVLITDEIMSNGTIDQTSVYPREIIKRALYHEAGAIILVHNHPSGNTKPSKVDIDLTNKIVETCRAINVTVHDHIIIGGNEFYSFKSNMIL